MTKIMLACQALHKTYQDSQREVNVLNNVNVEIKTGESVAIVGRSGSGKTTLLNILAGLDAPTQGRVWINQTELARLSERQLDNLRNQQLGLIFQFHHLLPEFSALENVAMPLLIQGLPQREINARSIDLLEKVGLGHRLYHRPAALSGGERQRVAIARALVAKPQCILADEPTGNLDKQSAEQVYQLMQTLVKENNSSFVMVTHDLTLANRMDRQIQLENVNDSK